MGCSVRQDGLPRGTAHPGVPAVSAGVQPSTRSTMSTSPTPARFCITDCRSPAGEEFCWIRAPVCSNAGTTCMGLRWKHRWILGSRSWKSRPRSEKLPSTCVVCFPSLLLNLPRCTAHPGVPAVAAGVQPSTRSTMSTSATPASFCITASQKSRREGVLFGPRSRTANRLLNCRDPFEAQIDPCLAFVETSTSESKRLPSL